MVKKGDEEKKKGRTFLFREGGDPAGQTLDQLRKKKSTILYKLGTKERPSPGEKRGDQEEEEGRRSFHLFRKKEGLILSERRGKETNLAGNGEGGTPAR